MGDTLGYFRYVFLALALAGILGMFVIRTLRKQALAENETTGAGSTGHPAPLTAEDFGGLLRWQKKMRLTALAVLFYLGMMVGLASSVPAEAWIVRWVVFLILPAIVIAGVVVQFSVRCPRRSMLLGLQSSLGIPDVCERCGVPLRGEALAPPRNHQRPRYATSVWAGASQCS